MLSSFSSRSLKSDGNCFNLSVEITLGHSHRHAEKKLIFSSKITRAIHGIGKYVTANNLLHVKWPNF